MTLPRKVDLNAIERELQQAFSPNEVARFSSTAGELQESEEVKSLALPRSARGKTPITRDKFIINENPARIEWERHVREFLLTLNTDFGHRVTAPMIFEWVTGISIAELAKAEGADQGSNRGGGHSGSANPHLRHINWVLKEYFGTSYKTKIAGREVGKAYTVRPAFFVRRKRPANLSLWPEWKNGVLDEPPKKKGASK